MNLLEERLRMIIDADGPVPLDRYMQQCLTDPECGYYTRLDDIGAKGDFITSPEISQMFGELIGLWIADMWTRMGSPDDAIIAELGPGKGTLMADALRAVQRAAPDLLAKCQLWLVEASPRLREIQGQRLEAYSPNWAETVEDIPEQPVLLIGNEFLDALPVRQIVRRGDSWLERAIGFDADDALAIVEITPQGEVPAELPPMAEGEVLEISPARSAVGRTVAAQIAVHGGAALLIDYGHELTVPGDTLQAMKAHRFHPILETPGEADLTSHVDFAALARTASQDGLNILGPIGQRQFLLRLGIEARLAQLLKNAEPEVANGLTSGFRRLTDPSHMGHLFKVMCLSHEQIGIPTGYVADEAFSHSI
jgi:NADH dehydrogenase [ubiquinone] 1 alpha subcomplex assembly factor 7